MSLHKNLDYSEIHPAHSLLYADSVARLAAGSFTVSDVGRIALQQSDGSFWALSSVSPVTWAGLFSSYLISHDVLRSLIHFIDDGPASGFATGAYKVTTYSGIFPIDEVWYTSSAQLLKIVKKTTTWTGILPTTIVWRMYNESGVILATVTDTVSYSGLFEANRSRTIA